MIVAKFFDIDRWANRYAQGTVYSFLWGKVLVEYETKDDRSFDPCYLQQWGRGQIYHVFLSLFGHTLSLTIWPLS